MNIDVPFENLAAYEDGIKKWMQRVDAESEKLIEKREENLYLMTVFAEVLRRVRYILPGLPPEIYQEFISTVKIKFAGSKKSAEWQVEIFEKIGPIFYSYLTMQHGINPEWFPQEGTLFDVYSEKYIDEAKTLIPAFAEHYSGLN